MDHEQAKGQACGNAEAGGRNPKDRFHGLIFQSHCVRIERGQHEKGVGARSGGVRWHGAQLVLSVDKHELASASRCVGVRHADWLAVKSHRLSYKVGSVALHEGVRISAETVAAYLRE